MTAPKDNDSTVDSNAVSVESTALFGISDTSLRLRQMSIRSAVAFPGKSGKTNYSDECHTAADYERAHPLTVGE